MPVAEGITIDVVTAGAVVTGLTAAIGVMFKLLIAAKDAQIAAMQAERDRAISDGNSYQATLEDLVNHVRRVQGEQPLTVESPARVDNPNRLQTVRAAVAQIKIADAGPGDTAGK